MAFRLRTPARTAAQLTHDALTRASGGYTTGLYYGDTKAFQKAWNKAVKDNLIGPLSDVEREHLVAVAGRQRYAAIQRINDAFLRAYRTGSKPPAGEDEDDWGQDALKDLKTATRELEDAAFTVWHLTGPVKMYALTVAGRITLDAMNTPEVAA